MRILLVNPPIYDFTAYDFWLKPYGMLSAAGLISAQADLALFDYLDRLTPAARKYPSLRSDNYNRGEYISKLVSKPPALADIPRRFRRFGLPREEFLNFLNSSQPFDFALIQCSMTYWYLGIQEVISDLRDHSLQTRIVLGGVYPSICPGHAKNLGADLVIEKNHLSPLLDIVGLAPDYSRPPAWHLYPALKSGVLKLTDGCPFKCTYCWVPSAYKGFSHRPFQNIKSQFDHLISCGARDIAFYDDALLFEPEKVLLPLLQHVIQNKIEVNFHTPNALHARFITPDIANLMVQAGFKTFYLGFESSSSNWQKQTGSKLQNSDLALAVKNLIAAGASHSSITAYIIAAHPLMDDQALEPSMQMAHDLGIRVMLADFSPIPSTPDGDACSKLVDLSEPLNHSKTAWPIRFLGNDRVNRLKDLCRALNNSL